PEGKKVEKTDLKWQEWPSDALFPGAIVKDSDSISPDKLIGKRAKRSFDAEEPFLESAVTSTESKNVLTAKLDKNKRAMAIDVSAESMVGGFLVPGDFVDIIMTYKVKIDRDANQDVKNTVQSLASEIILQNIRVLAIDQLAEPAAEDKGKVGRTVTLEVDAKQQQILALAGTLGELHLALRAAGDDIILDTSSETTTDVNIGQTLNKVTELQKTKRKQSDTVRVYSNSGVVDRAVNE
ncbi:MAG: Flp pilus assembly protein CpaB, partial [Pseudomonadota bacterium]|nr:Flp pilus assembly protein CpaB [Pseudomonadota bacterium]